MKYYSLSLQMAQAYGSGAYSSCTYSEGQTAEGACATSGGGATTTSGGGLADTGIAVIAIVTLACLLVFVALVVRLWRRKPVPQAVAINDARQDETSSSGAGLPDGR